MVAAVDTNVFVSGLIGSPTNRRIIKALKEFRFELVITPLIFEEIKEVIKRPKFRGLIDEETAKELIEIIKIQAVFIELKERLNIVADPADDELLSCAKKAKANLIVTGDKELLNLSFVIPIIPPKEFIARL